MEVLAVRILLPLPAMFKTSIGTWCAARLGCWAIALLLASAAFGAVDVADAGAHVGETVTVRGEVAQVSKIGSGMVFLNFGAPHPESIFTVVVRPGFEGIEDWSIFEGKEVEVTGKVEIHKDKPQIVLRDASEIRITGSADASAPPQSQGDGNSGSSVRTGEFQVTLTPEERRLAGTSPGGVEPTEATMALMLPRDFDPSKRNKVLVVFATDDNGGAHVKALPRFGRIANEAGWLAMAVNGPVLEKNLTPQWHAAMVLAGLRELENRYPGAKGWEFYAGGNSGGAARASMMTGPMLAEGYAVSGVFMGGAGGERFSTGEGLFPKSRTAMRNLAVFLSHGSEDHLVSEQQSESNAKAIKALGIRNVRRDRYEGGHGMNEDSLRKALEWFDGKSMP